MSDFYLLQSIDQHLLTTVQLLPQTINCFVNLVAVTFLVTAHIVPAISASKILRGGSRFLMKAKHFQTNASADKHSRYQSKSLLLVWYATKPGSTIIVLSTLQESLAIKDTFGELILSRLVTTCNRFHYLAAEYPCNTSV